jgi:hypothetical protein
MIDLAIMARSSLDADQPHNDQVFKVTALDLTMMAGFKIKPLTKASWLLSTPNHKDTP